MATSGEGPVPGAEPVPQESPVRVPGAPVALSTASVYPQTCADGFAIAAELGYDGLEVMVWTDPVSQDAAGLVRLVEHYDVPVLSVHSPTLLVTQRVWGREPWAKLHRSCRLAVDLGARTVVVHPPFRWQREYAAGIDALAMARALGDRLTHLHLADGEGSAKDEHLVPGQGTQPCDEMLGLLAEWNWTGTVVVEVNTRRARTREEREADLAEALAFARLHLASRVPAADNAGGRA